ncbi:helix-turn-helix domain-containing protein [Streptomyces sp. NPDC053048]|uniref:helix-turn-helix domain-containing protein n=1 Tax=Streptomyces sp. NPDC053048 TaxID=3365694 RepID=UPI0037D62A95
MALSMRTAARAFDVSVNTAYKLVKSGEFPCETIRVGRQHRVPTAAVMRALGIEEIPVYTEDIRKGIDFAAESEWDESDDTLF